VRVNLALLFVIVAMFGGSSILGQSPNASISGVVLDPDKKSIAEAEILVVNDYTRVQYEAKTNAEGFFAVTNLPPGQYRIQVSKVGFKAIIKPDIVIHVEDALAINFTLPIGASSVVVTVEGGAPLVNTESAAVSTVIDRQFIENLPLNGRSFNTLLQLTPGVVIAQTTGSVSTGQFSIAGQRSDANNFTVDGVSANFGVTPGPTGIGQSGLGSSQAFSAIGATSTLVSVEALQEFRIITSTFAPEFGRSPGGQVVLTTRSGTNSFHGGAYEYFRNDVLDANDWFINSVGKPRVAERHNDFGAYLGGPIHKDNTFFFVSYEGARLRIPQSAVIVVPSAYARTTAASALTPFLDVYPQPDSRTPIPGVYTAQFTGAWSNRATLNAGSIRIDHTFNHRFSVFGRYNDAPSLTAQRWGDLSTSLITEVNTRTLTLGLNMLLTNSISNSLRGNYSTQSALQTYVFDSIAGALALDPGLLAGSLAAKTNLVFAPSDSYEVKFTPTGKNETKQLNFVDDLLFTINAHQLKLGADYRAIFLDATPPLYNSIFTVTSIKTFLSSGGTGTLEADIASPSRLLAQSFSMYAQDTWRPTSRLTLTYGLRWELAPAPSARGTTRLASWENVTNPATFALAPAGTPVWKTTYTNFAPRIGIAYRLTAEGDFVLRAGGGLFYDLGVGQAGNLAGNFPNLFANIVQNASVPITDLTLSLPSTLVQPPYSPAYGFSPDLKLPRSYQWNVALEKSFAGEQVISATYVGQSGRDLLRGNAYYQPNPNFGSYFMLDTNGARSNYNALQIQYRKPLSAHVQALFNYSYSHSLDNSSNDVFGSANTVISNGNDYASSDFDSRHSFSGALSLQIPGLRKSPPLSFITKDWSLDTVVVARSGFPFNGAIFVASPVVGFTYVRPDRMPGVPLYLHGAECAAALGVPSCPGGQGLNPAAFTGFVGDQGTPRIPAGTIPTDANGNPLRQGTEARNDIPGFGLTQLDLSIRRKFSLRGSLNLQFRADAFNVLNHPNFANPDANPYDGPGVFGVSGSMLNQGLGGLNPLFQAGGPRSLQLSLRLTF